MKFAHILFCFFGSAFLALGADLAELIRPDYGIEVAVVEADVPPPPAGTSLPRATVPPEASPAPVEPRLIERDELLVLLQEELTMRFSLSGELQIIPTTRLPRLRARGDDLNILFVGPPPQRISARMVLRVAVLSGGELSDPLVLPVQLEHRAPVYVSRAGVGRGEDLDPAQFFLEEQDTLRLSQEPVAAGTDLSRFLAAATIAPGKALTWRQLAPRPILRAGQNVEVIAEEGALRIVLKAQALEDGDAGDFIRVRNLQSRKELHAQVIDATHVQVYF